VEREGYLHRYQLILTEENPTFPDVDGDKLALERQYGRMNFREALRDWRMARKEVVATLRKIKGGQWLRTGTHESLGSMSLEEILKRQALGNDEAHLGQIENIKKRWELLEKLRDTPKAVASLLQGVSDEALRRRPAPGKWSMLEIACHLRDVEQLFLERYAKIANHERPALRMMNQDQLAGVLKYNEDDSAMIMQEFKASRAETIGLLYGLAYQSWQRVGLHPKRGEFTIANQVDLHVNHDTNHLNQIRSLREGSGIA